MLVLFILFWSTVLVTLFIFLLQLDDLDMYLASDDSASDDEGADNHGDESLQSGAKKKLTREERLALLLQGDKSEEEQTDGEDMEITFNTELEDLSKRILDRKVNNEKTVWEKHQEKMKEKRKSRKKRSKDDDEDGDDDDGYSSEDGLDEHDDFFDDEMSDEEIKPNKKQKAKAKDKGKGKGKDKLPEQHLEDEATREELELLVAADKDAGNGAKGYNLKRKKGKKGKKGKEQSVEDELPDIDLSKDERFSAMFNSHLFALDPTDPQYKRYTMRIPPSDYFRIHTTSVTYMICNPASSWFSFTHVKLLTVADGY